MPLRSCLKISFVPLSRAKMMSGTATAGQSHRLTTDGEAVDAASHVKLTLLTRYHNSSE